MHKMIRDIVKKLYGIARSCAISVLKVKNTHELIREYDKVYGKGNYIALYPPQGMGDILACCCGIEYLNTGGKRVVVLVSKKYFIDIKFFFPKDYVDLYYFKKNLSDKPYKCYYPLTRKMYLSGQPFISMKYNMCLAMGIRTDVIFHNHYRKKDEFCGLPSIKNNKTVFISPFATACKDELDYEFWETLASRLIEREYDVLFNAPSDSLYSNKFETCLLNLEDTVELVDRCGFFVGWRSGLCDIIGMYSNANKIIIYPSNPHKVHDLYIPTGQTYPIAYKNSCSLKTLWGKDAIEIINHQGLLEQIVNVIIDDN